MAEQTTLYRVVREHRYDGGRGQNRLEGIEVLYCGYDRLEAVRVYYQYEAGTGTNGQGNYYYHVRFQRKRVAAEA